MKRNAIAFVVGILFALGLGISGMTDPRKIIGFLDIQNWDPTLIFVMIGAIAVHAPLYQLIRKRQTPLLDIEWHVPDRKDVNSKLILGAILFGVGWSLGGFCPGPAITSMASLKPEIFLFGGSMLAGMKVYDFWGHKLV